MYVCMYVCMHVYAGGGCRCGLRAKAGAPPPRCPGEGQPTHAPLAPQGGASRACARRPPCASTGAGVCADARKPLRGGEGDVLFDGVMGK